jgi:hypothetical protein
MGSYRQRFTPAEREAFTVGTEVEWLNATTWKPGRVHAAITTGDGFDPRQQEIKVENRATTGHTRLGEVVTCLPKHVRIVTKEA